MKKIFLLTATIFCFLNLTNAQPGQLDPSFGNHGIVTTDLGKKFPYGHSANQILSAPDGSIYVIVGDGFGTLTRRFPNGSIDSSFGLNASIENSRVGISRAAIQPDGKIVGVGGGVVRYNTNGQLDSSFSGDGKQTIDLVAYAVAIQKNGKIVVAGTLNGSNSEMALARFNTDGSPDNTFGDSGLVKSNLNYKLTFGFTTSIAIQNDGKIVVAGGFSIVRYYADGTPDETFSGNGIHAFSAFYSIAIQNNGKIAAVGLNLVQVGGDPENTEINFSICRLNTDGSFDKSFSDDGVLPTQYETISLVLQSDEKIVTAVNPGFTIIRYNVDGSLDSSFSGDGKQTTEFGNGGDVVETVAIQSDGKILAAGSSFYGEDVAIARYNPDGSLDNTFDEDGKLVDAFRVGRTLYEKSAIQKDGKIVVAGSTYSGISSDFLLAIVRYNTNGSLDSTFSNDGIQVTSFKSNQYDIHSVMIQSDEKILVSNSNVLVRFNADGSLDSTFSIDNGRETIRSLAIQNDGKIVVEGSTSNGTFEISRYNINGAADKTFGQNGKQTLVFNTNNGAELQGYASSIAIQSDGKIVLGGVGGRDYPYGNSTIFLIRLNTNGSLDNTFSNDGKVSFNKVGATSVFLVIQNGDKIVIGSDFADLNSNDGVSLKRFNTDGSIDAGFNGITPLHHQLSTPDNTSIALQSDGKIVLAGSDLLRFNANGGIDSTFNINAKQKVDFYINDLAISNNKLYAVGGGQYGIVARYLLEGSNTPPTITLKTPTNNTIRLAPAAHIKLSAAAADKDGTITKVEFYNGTTLLHTETVFPYGFTWRNVGVGNYTLTAKAYDNSGLATTSAPVHISVVPNKPPVVKITKPVNNRSFAAPGYIHLEAAASDTDGRVTNVKFYNGSTLLRTEYEYPYTYHWENVPAGTYTITAVATDNWGAHTASAPVTIRVKSMNTMMVSGKPVNNKTVINDAVSLKLSPNPATNVVNIYTQGLPQNKPATVSIISVSGNVLKTMQSNNSTTQLDVSSLVSGVYTIKIVSGGSTVYKQFVKM